MSAIDELVAAARRRLPARLDPHQAAEAQRSGTLLVDIRPTEQRRQHGRIPGALVIERNVLEWRLDPTSPDRHLAVGDEPPPIVVVCQAGYASSLAAATLLDLGLTEVTDLDGGVAAWTAAGLPVEPEPERPTE